LIKHGLSRLSDRLKDCRIDVVVQRLQTWRHAASAEHRGTYSPDENG
jgi:hypothetical protein